LEGTPLKLSTTVTTGVIASYIYVGKGNITGFASRFGSTFDEYRILGADVKITPLSASVGVTKFWWDEKADASPTANEAQERVSTPLANTNASAASSKIMRWRARDLLDLEYTPIGTDVKPAFFKVYTDTSTWGAPTTVTDLWLIEPRFIVEFRGLKST
jgi:hypothetical protein